MNCRQPASPQRPWLLLVLLLLALAATTACSKTKAPDTPPTPPTQAPAPGSPEADIAHWADIVAKQPTPDNWNELSYANIKAQRWDAAIEAGQEALMLKHDHPYALYNVGLALLKSDRPMEATYPLKETAALQPDRHEPPMLLSQAYRQLGHYLLARHYAAQAVSLAKDDPEAQRTQQSAVDMLQVKPPADLATACAEKFADEGFTLCLYKEQAPELDVSSGASSYPGNRYTLWYGRTGEPLKALPIGYTQPAEFKTTALPGGSTGYWLKGPFVGAGVAGTEEWRLFVRDGNDLRQILFLGGDRYEGGRVSDYMRSPYTPPIEGEQIVIGHRDDVTGSRTIRRTRQLSLANGTATVIAEQEIIRGPLTKLTPEVEVEAEWGYKWSYGLAADARILLDGKPASQADLKVGMYATITVRDGKIIDLTAQSPGSAP